MKKITLILPYFGKKFPDMFPLLVYSMSLNTKVDFIIFTNIHDDILEQYKSENIFVKYTTLEYIKNLASKKLNFNVVLDEPYKLCDFRPFYGIIFEDYLQDVNWWGYFDSDIIFGDLNSFIDKFEFEKYDRVFTHGHLTFYRNIESVNKVALKDFRCKAIPNYKKVLSNKEIYGFDEWGFRKNKGRGISWIIDKTKILKQYDNISLFSDILPHNFFFKTTIGDSINYFIFTNGKLEGMSSSGEKKEYLYAHFQKRPMCFKNICLNKKIYVFPNYFSNSFNYDENKKRNEERRWEKFYIRKRIIHILNNINISYIKKRISFIRSEK